jgi:hypothetical protein
MPTHLRTILASLLGTWQTTATAARQIRPTTRQRRSDLAAQGRGAVIWGLAFFTGLTALFFPLAERQPVLRDAEYGMRFQMLRRQVHDKPPDQPCVVMLGSSLTAMGFNPSALTTVKPASEGGPVVFNFGLPSGRSVVQLLTLRRMLAGGVRPDFVLIDTQGAFCAGANQFGAETYYPLLRLQGNDLPVICRYDPDGDAVCDRWLRLQRFPWLSYRKNLQACLLPRWATAAEQSEMSWRFIDQNGWLVLPHYLDGTKHWSHEQKSQSPRYWAKGISSQPCSESLIRVYREIVSLCQRVGVRIVMVRMPEYSVMRAEIKPETQAQLDLIHADFSRATGEPVIDARAWVPDDEIFDGTHLSPAGSVRFTRRLEKDALEPLLFKRTRAEPPTSH